MKKLFAILLTLCLMASMLCVTTFAAETYVIRVTGLKEDDTLYYPEGCGYTNFADGWEAAVNYANSKKWMSDNDVVRVVVDFFADWKANDEGEFGDSGGLGFQFSTIYVPSNTRITINLNGHTINRGLKVKEYDGEVICINDDADLIINNGTITGGWSRNGAGGIHMQDDSKLTLNNVHIVGNKTEDDDGGGIAIYNGASLTMKGGSIANNEAIRSSSSLVLGAGVHIKKSTAEFHNVTFQNNHSNGNKEYSRDQSYNYNCYGAAINANASTLTFDSCKFYDNGKIYGNFLNTLSVIHVENDSKLTFKNTTFERNGGGQHYTNGQSSVYWDTNLFQVLGADLSFENCSFSNNHTGTLFDMPDNPWLTNNSTLVVTNSTFRHNNSAVYTGAVSDNGESIFANCTFEENTWSDAYPYVFEFSTQGSNPTFMDCDFGNSNFNDRSRARFVDTDASDGSIGSIFGEGSLTNILVILSLVCSVISISLTISLYRKKAAPQKEE